MGKHGKHASTTLRAFGLNFMLKRGPEISSTQKLLDQVLADVGFTILGGSSVYWVGEAMGSVNYKDLKHTPKKLAGTIRTQACNAAHLAALLKEQRYPVPNK